MLEWGQPLWAIVGLGLVPGIWWLHRFQRQRGVIEVSAAFLWPSRAREQRRDERRARTDPRWWLRALAALGLCFAVAQPQWTLTASRQLEIWFDGSDSMDTLEDGQPRWRQGVALLADQLRDIAADRITARALRQPGHSMVMERTGDLQHAEQQLGQWLSAAGPELSLPLPIQMDRRAEHWLVTDGADPELSGWAESAPLDRVIQVGSTSENVGIARLSLRRSLQDAGSLLGHVETVNFGTETATRRLTVDPESDAPSIHSLVIPPGETATTRFEIRSPQSRLIRAAIWPADALSLDDNMTTNSQALTKPSVELQGPCGQQIEAAIRAHPAVDLEGLESPEASLVVGCGAEPPQGTIGHLWFPPSAGLRAVEAAPIWHSRAVGLQDLVLDPSWLSGMDRRFAGTGFRPLLSAGDTALILAREAPPRQVAVLIDLEASDLSSRPEFPALVGGLIDWTLQRTLLQSYASTARRHADSMIAPRPIAGPRASLRRQAHGHALDLAPYMLVAALLFLLLDIGRDLRGRGNRPSTKRSADPGPSL